MLKVIDSRKDWDELPDGTVLGVLALDKGEFLGFAEKKTREDGLNAKLYNRPAIYLDEEGLHVSASLSTNRPVYQFDLKGDLQECQLWLLGISELINCLSVYRHVIQVLDANMDIEVKVLSIHEWRESFSGYYERGNMDEVAIGAALVNATDNWFKFEQLFTSGQALAKAELVKLLG